MENINQKLGLIIKNIRRHKNISQLELSKQLNYSQSVLSKVEQGYGDINLETYELILKTLGMNFYHDEKIDQLVSQLMSRLYDAMLYLDIETIDHIMDELDPFMPNVLYYYDYLICELVQNMLMEDYEECSFIVSELESYIPICTEASKHIFHYIKTILTSINNREIKNTNYALLTSDKEDGLVDYYNGIYSYYHFNYTVSLNYLFKAMTTFTNQNNLKRLSKVEIYINKILMKENDYFDIEIRTNAFLKNVEMKINPNDLYSLQFQLAYSKYYLKKYEEALEIFKSLKDQEFRFKKWINYMIDKCLYQLGINHFENPTELNNPYQVLYQLFHSYTTNNKDKAYYQLIETQIIPNLKQNLYVKEYQLYSLDLMNHYFKQKQYKKYKKLTEEFTIIYKVI